MQERWLLGTPEDIAAKIAKWQPRLGMDHLIFTPRPPGMPLRQAVDEIERLDRKARYFTFGMTSSAKSCIWSSSSCTELAAK